MEVTAKLSNLRATARKTRQVVDLIRGKKASDAKVLLSFATRKPAEPVLKLLNSAIASAKSNHQIAEENLYISKITVDEGPTFKRWHAMSRGRAYPIMKRTSHITIVLSEIGGIKDQPKKNGNKVKNTKVADKTETVLKPKRKKIAVRNKKSKSK